MQDIVVKPYYQPPQVLPKDIKDNGKILTDEQIRKAKGLLDAAESDHVRKNPDNKTPEQLSKHFSSKNKISELPYTVKKINHRYYAVYRVRDEPDETLKKSGIAAGAGGTFKLMQDLESGQWVGLKVTKDVNQNELEGKLERQNLETFGLSLGHTRREKKKSKTPYYYYSVMTLAKGISLSAFLESTPNITYQQYLLIAFRILATYKLNFADKDWVHLDIKPDNIMIDKDTFEITFVDLGCAEKIDTDLDRRVGTPGYISPEIWQFLRNRNNKTKVNTACDVYSLGQTLQVLFGLKKMRREASNILPAEEVRIWESRTNENDRKNIIDCIEGLVKESSNERTTLDDAINFLMSQLVTVNFITETIKHISFDGNCEKNNLLVLYTKEINDYASEIVQWFNEQTDLVVKKDFIINLEHVLREVIDIDYFTYTPKQVRTNLDSYKANILKIDQLNTECEKFKAFLNEKPQNFKEEIQTLNNISSTLKINSTSPKITAERISEFKLEYQKVRPVLKKVPENHKLKFEDTRKELQKIPQLPFIQIVDKILGICDYVNALFFKPKHQFTIKIDKNIKPATPSP